jgi:hypothetical protein
MDIGVALTTVLQYVGASAPPVMSEQEFLRRVVEGFANTGYIPSLLHGVGRAVPDFSVVKRLHEQFCADLEAVIDNRLSSADRKRIFASADCVLLVPRTNADGTMKFQYLPQNPESAIAHALRLLADASRPYKNDLKQCQWKECRLWPDIPDSPDIRRFFFVSDRRKAAVEAGKEPTGKLPDRYCSEEHMRAAHRARATEATMRRRKQIREGKIAVKAKHK